MVIADVLAELIDVVGECMDGGEVSNVYNDTVTGHIEYVGDDVWRKVRDGKGNASYLCPFCDETYKEPFVESIRGKEICDDCLPKEQDRIAKETS